MRIMIRPSSCPNLPVDVTSSLVATLAGELTRLQPGGEQGEANWREAELLLEQIVGRSVAGPCMPRDSCARNPRDTLRTAPPLFNDEHHRAARREETRLTEDSTADWPVR